MVYDIKKSIEGVQDIDIKFDVLTSEDKKMQFRDTDLYIYSSTNGQLDIVADGTIALSGAVTTDGSLTMTMTNESAPIVMTNTITTATTLGCRALFYVTANCALGSYANGLKGYIEFTGTGGRVAGLASGVCAELKMPNVTMSSGWYFPLEIEYVAGGDATTTAGIAGNRAGFIFMRASGDDGGDFDDNGVLFAASGLTAAAGGLLSADELTLRCVVGTYRSETTRYLMLSEKENGLQIGASGAGIAYTEEEGGINSSIYSNYTGTTGFFRGLYVESTYTPDPVATGEASVYGIRATTILATGCKNVEASSERMVGVDGCFENKGTLQGAGVWVAGTRGALYGAGIWTTVKFVAAVLGACQITSAVGTGIYSAFAAYSTSTTPDAVINTHGAFTVFADFTNAITCMNTTASASNGTCKGKILVRDTAGELGYINVFAS